MSLNTELMENKRVYEIMNNKWFIVKYEGKLFHGDILYIFEFNELGKIQTVVFGKQVNKSIHEYNNKSEFTIKGWKIDNKFHNEGDYTKLGNSKYAEEYVFAKETLTAVLGEELVTIQEEIDKVIRNPQLYFDELIPKRKIKKEFDIFQENNTVDGFEPIDWTEVIETNKMFSGRKRRR